MAYPAAEDLYASFLDGIRRTSHGTVKKNKFCRLWNEWALQEWLKKFRIQGSKESADLAPVYIITDGTFTYNSAVLNPIAVDSGSDVLFSLPVRGSTTLTDTSGNSVTYPVYHRMISADFQLDSSSGSWIPGVEIKKNARQFITSSSLFSPDSTRLYYIISNNKVQLFKGADADDGFGMRISYIRYPNEMSYSSDDNYLSLTNDLGNEQYSEIRDVAVRMYLERISDPRWQSFLAEERQRNQ